MKFITGLSFTFGVAALFLLPAAAQSLSNITSLLPPCIQECLPESVLSSGCPITSSTNITCLCQSSSFISSAVSCAQTSNCDPSTISSAESELASACSAEGVSVSIPPSASATSVSGTSSAQSTQSTSVSGTSSAQSTQSTASHSSNSAADLMMVNINTLGLVAVIAGIAAGAGMAL